MHAWLWVAMLAGAGGEAAEPAGSADTAVLRAMERALETAIDRVLGSVVTVGRQAVRGRGGGDLLEEGVHESWRATGGTGTGVVIKSDGLILTNYHLTVPLDESVRWQVTVWLPGGKPTPAEVLAADPRSDLAVLRIPVKDLRPVTLARGGTLRRGQIVLVLPRPYPQAGEGLAAATWAMINNLERGPEADTETIRRTVHAFKTLIQLDTRMGEVGSGAPVVNLDGELIALTTSAEAIAGFEEAGTFAIPLGGRLAWIVDKLVRGEAVEYGFLGVSSSAGRRLEWPEEPAPAESASGVYVAEVIPCSPAQAAGLRAQDLICRIDGRPIRQFEDLSRGVGLRPAGDTCRVEFVRGQAVQAAEVVLGKYPGSGRVIAARRPPWRGLRLDWITALMDSRAQWERLKAAERRRPRVAIIACEEDSPAYRAGVRAGQILFSVNGRPAESPDQCLEMLHQTAGEVRLETDERTVTVPAAGAR